MSQSIAELILSWLPFLIYVGTWVWGVAVFKGYKRSRERFANDNTEALNRLVEANRQIAAMLSELKTELRERKA